MATAHDQAHYTEPMSNNIHLTRCHHCSTPFRVTDEQLSIANGIVRCGACLQVFDARSHFIDESSLAFDGKLIKQEPYHPDSDTPSDQPNRSKLNKKPNKKANKKADHKLPIKDHLTFDAPDDALDKSILDNTPDDDLDDDLLEHVDLSAIQDGDHEDDKPPLSKQNQHNSPAASSHPIEQEDDPDETWADELLKELENEDADILKSLGTESEDPLNEPDLDTGFDKKSDSDTNKNTDEESELDVHFFEKELNNLQSETLIHDQNPTDATESSSSLQQRDELSDELGDDELNSEPNDELSEAFSQTLSEDRNDEPQTEQRQTEEHTSPRNDILDDEDTLVDVDVDLDVDVDVDVDVDLDADADVDEQWAKSMLEELEGNQTQDHHNLSESDKLFIAHTAREKEKREALHTPKPISSDMTLDDELSSETKEQSKEEQPDISDDTGHNTSLHGRSLTDILQAKKEQRNTINHKGLLEEDFELITHRKQINIKFAAGFILWTLASLSALGGLTAQHLYFNFDTLALKSNYRPFYEEICSRLHCTLPNRVAIGKIVNRNLVIREHPEIEHALMIDTIMINEAQFAQPFPDMAILFSDINGQTVAYRRFTPKEYKGDLDINHVPPHTPVHITLEIEHPGLNATSWTVHFKSPSL